MFDLAGKKALVTGSSGGLGEAIARMLHQRGAIVGIHGTREEKLNEIAGELGERVMVFPANLSDREIFVAVPADAASVTDETEVSLLPEVGNSNDRHVLSSEDVINGGEYPGSTLEVFRGSMNADWVINDNYILTSISGFTNADMTQRYDLDRLALGRPDQFLGHGDVDTYGTTKLSCTNARTIKRM